MLYNYFTPPFSRTLWPGLYVSKQQNYYSRRIQHCEYEVQQTSVIYLNWWEQLYNINTEWVLLNRVVINLVTIIIKHIKHAESLILNTQRAGDSNKVKYS